MGQLHVRDEMEDEGGEYGREQLTKSPPLNKLRYELKHSKHTRLHGDELSIAITLSTPHILTVDHTSYIPDSHESRVGVRV